MKTVSIIRNRGQLTIPESVREILPWTNPLSAVSITVTSKDEITIKPHKNLTDWNKIWKGIEKSRQLKGTGKTVSATKFLEADRSSH